MQAEPVGIIYPGMDSTGHRSNSVIHAARVVAAFALGGAVFLSLGLGWIPALAAIDLHAVGGLIGGVIGSVAASAKAV